MEEESEVGSDEEGDDEGDGETGDDSVSRWTAFSNEEGAGELFLWKWLDKVEFSCALCEVCDAAEGTEAQEMHGDDVEDWCEPEIEEGYGAVRQKIQFADNSCCFQCMLPWDWCMRAKEEAGKGKDDGCVYMNKILPVVLMALGWDTIVPWMREKHQVDIRDRKAFFRWLARRTRFYDTNGANIHILWEAILRRVYKQETKE
jgi:hypothetical protein